MAVTRGTLVDRNVYLTLGGAPAASVLPSQVLCKYKKNGDDGLTIKILDASNWINLGQGFYTLRLMPDETDVTGYFFFTLSSTQFDNFTYGEFTIEPTNIFQSVSSPEICVVSGSIRTVGNTVPKNTKAIFRPVHFPSTTSGSLISAEAVTGHLSAYGTFSVELIQGSTVIAEIEGTGIRAQIEIPYEPTADLMTLLPPISVTY